MNEDDETKANLDPVPVDPGLSALVDKFVPVPAILADPVDDSAPKTEQELEAYLQSVQLVSILKDHDKADATIDLGYHVVKYIRSKSEKGKTLSDLMVELSHDVTFQKLMAAAR